jgi:hypothetical protein
MLQLSLGDHALPRRLRVISAARRASREDRLVGAQQRDVLAPQKPQKPQNEYRHLVSHAEHTPPARQICDQLQYMATTTPAYPSPHSRHPEHSRERLPSNDFHDGCDSQLTGHCRGCPNSLCLNMFQRHKSLGTNYAVGKSNSQLAFMAVELHNAASVRLTVDAYAHIVFECVTSSFHGARSP